MSAGCRAKPADAWPQSPHIAHARFSALALSKAAVPCPATFSPQTLNPHCPAACCPQVVTLFDEDGISLRAINANVQVRPCYALPQASLPSQNYVTELYLIFLFAFLFKFTMRTSGSARSLIPRTCRPAPAEGGCPQVAAHLVVVTSAPGQQWYSLLFASGRQCADGYRRAALCAVAQVLWHDAPRHTVSGQAVVGCRRTALCISMLVAVLPRAHAICLRLVPAGWRTGSSSPWCLSPSSAARCRSPFW